MWQVLTTDIFDEWFDALDDTDRTNVIASLMVLEQKGPNLARPHVDSMKGSIHSNMKELRGQSKGNPLRAFFAFDPKRNAILLCAGNKKGNDKRFYKEMLPVADAEFTKHLNSLNLDG